MINQKKVEIMTHAAMFEHTRKNTLKLNKYFRKRYKTAIALRSIPIGLLIGALSAFLAITAGYGFFREILRGRYMWLAVLAIILGIAVITVLYVAVSVIVLGKKFDREKGVLRKYKLSLVQLSKIYGEE